MSTTVLYERRQRLHRGFELITRHHGVHEAEALGVVRREDVPGEQQLVRFLLAEQERHQQGDRAGPVADLGLWLDPTPESRAACQRLRPSRSGRCQPPTLSGAERCQVTIIDVTGVTGALAAKA